MSNDRERLLRLLTDRSVMTGEFVLTSGQRSNVYVDTKLTTTGAVAMSLIGPAFIALFKACGWWKPDAVVGMTLGADPLLGAISYASAVMGDPLDHLIARKEAKGHGTQRRLEGRLEGIQRVIVVDDVWTTGGSTVSAIEAAREAGLTVIGAAALLDREQGAADRLKPLPTASLFRLQELLALKNAASE